MSKKEILCESCDAVFRIQHNMEENYYSVEHCPFCSDELNTEEKEEIEDFDEAEW